VNTEFLQENAALTKTLDLNFESAASAIPPLRRGIILGYLENGGKRFDRPSRALQLAVAPDDLRPAYRKDRL
jgi:hypothetical protein